MGVTKQGRLRMNRLPVVVDVLREFIDKVIHIFSTMSIVEEETSIGRCSMEVLKRRKLECIKRKRKLTFMKVKKYFTLERGYPTNVRLI